MKFCPHCGKELSAQTAFCPECGKSLSGKSDFLNLPKKFWMTFIGAVGVLVFSLFEWVDFGHGVSFNLFNLWGKLEDSGLNWLLGGSSDFQNAKTFMVILSVAFIASFILLVISLIKYQSKERAMIAYLGFGLASLVPAIFMISIILVINEGIAESGLTIFPFLTFIVAVIALIFFVKKPIITQSDQRSAITIIYRSKSSDLIFIILFK